LSRSGKIDFPVAAAPGIQADFDTAVALLHSFFYEEARRRFEELAARDPGCAMAWWGLAMTHYHPLWAPPTPEELLAGAKAVTRARELGGKTDRERAFIDAIGAFFSSNDASSDRVYSESCHGPRNHAGKAIAFASRMKAMHEKWPDDVDVIAFTALSLLGTASPSDKTYPNPLKAAALLEPLFVSHPNHPGVIHYLIHAYDYPELATRGLPAARRYASVAPRVPHALHMPSHIFTRLGLWPESIESNQQSARASRDYMTLRHGGATAMDELHALDYAVFAWLQTDRAGKAEEALRSVAARKTIRPAKDLAAAHALAAMPARAVLERRLWKEAAALAPTHPDFVTAFPFTESLLEFTHAVGSARSGDVEGASRAVARIEALGKTIQDPKWKFWSSQVEIQRNAAAGWLAFAKGDRAGAERSLRAAADLEDSAGIHPVNPGALLPAREQLGDLLLELGRPADALKEYETSFKSMPDRFNALYGAGKSAEGSGDAAKARKHYGRLLEVSAGGEGTRAEIKHARAYLAVKP
jgi:tetratricopeptide (TPR) repeat protein